MGTMIMVEVYQPIYSFKNSSLPNAVAQFKKNTLPTVTIKLRLSYRVYEWLVPHMAR